MRVLVVEDDQKLAAVLRRGLKEQGYSVDLAAVAAQGFDMAMASEDGAILLDVLRDLRACGSRSPILVLSARSSVPGMMESRRHFRAQDLRPA